MIKEATFYGIKQSAVSTNTLSYFVIYNPIKRGKTAIVDDG